MKHGRALVALVCVAFTPLAARAGSVDITACGQQVPARSAATLQVDLTSCPPDSLAVILEDGVKLDLNGHSVASGDVGVYCFRRCKVRGPGAITGARAGLAIVPNENARVQLSDLQIHGNVQYGIQYGGGTEASKAPRVKLKNVKVHHNGTGIYVWQGFLSGSDVEVSDNFTYGFNSIQVFKFKRLVVQNNGRDGLHARFGGGRLLDSSFAFNGSQPGDVDLRTLFPPKLANTECDRSAGYNSGIPWGVCASD